MAFDFRSVTAPFRMQPGLRKLAGDAHHLTPNRPGARALREKLAVLSSYWPQALVMTAGFDPRAALDTLLARAALEHPGVLTRIGSTIEAAWLGWSLNDGEPVGDGDPAIGACLRGLPLEWRIAALTSLAFAEDFAIVDTATAHVPWMAVCLPSSWAPERKVGGHFADIHAAVADNAVLLAAGPHLAKLVGGPERWERFVWTITSEPRLHRHPARSSASTWPTDADASRLAGLAFLRTERQTFLPVHGAAQAIFTIHVDVQPLVDALVVDEDAARVRDALLSMSPAVLAYKGLTDARERLLEWLDARCVPTAVSPDDRPPTTGLAD